MYQIDCAAQSEAVRGSGNGIQSSSDASECHGCLGLVTNGLEEENRFNPGSSVTIDHELFTLWPWKS